MERFWKYKLDHVLFWVATVGFHAFTKVRLVEEAGAGHFFLEIVVRNGLLAMLIYCNLLVLIPGFAARKKILAYSLLLSVTLALYVAAKNAHDLYLYGYVMDGLSQWSFFTNTYYNFSIAVFYLAFSVALALSKAWYFQKELIRKMEVERLNAELEYLKAQINPHFVFNSINTIYFQIDRNNELARQSLSDFSDMLRYQLYECNGNEIPIEKEVKYIKSYVAMQRMRKDENYNIVFSESPDVKGFSICPLLLIPFVENAFKHVSHSGRNEIRIDLRRVGNSFRLSVFNTREKTPVNGTHSGIGLKNARRRLDLLYGGRHELVIVDRPEDFEVHLSLHIDGVKEPLKS